MVLLRYANATETNWTASVLRFWILPEHNLKGLQSKQIQWWRYPALDYRLGKHLEPVCGRYLLSLSLNVTLLNLSSFRLSSVCRSYPFLQVLVILNGGTLRYRKARKPLANINHCWIDSAILNRVALLILWKWRDLEGCNFSEDGAVKVLSYDSSSSLPDLLDNNMVLGKNEQATEETIQQFREESLWTIVPSFAAAFSTVVLLLSRRMCAL